MIFVDTNVFMHAVGRPHPLQAPAREFFATSARRGTRLCTSAEVLQELAHAYLPAGRVRTLDAAMTLVARADVEVWPLEEADVRLARQLHESHPALGARDLCHLACCRQRGVSQLMTFDRSLGAAARTPAARSE